MYWSKVSPWLAILCANSLIMEFTCVSIIASGSSMVDLSMIFCTASSSLVRFASFSLSLGKFLLYIFLVLSKCIELRNILCELVV